MSQLIDIITTPVVTATWDVFWNGSGYATGGRRVHTLVISHRSAQGSKESEQLMKILAACQMPEGSYHMITIDEQELLAWRQLRPVFNPRIVLLMGVAPSQLGISALFQLNEPNRFDDTIWLPTLPIAQMEEQPALKKELWEKGIKPLFIETQTA
jgi:hypothetical protein